MSAPGDEAIDLRKPEADPAPHRSLVMKSWLALQNRSLDSLVADAQGGDDEASRLLLKTFVLQHKYGTINPAILDYVAGCLATITFPPRKPPHDRVPDSETMTLAQVEEAFSLHQPTATEVWKAFHLDRPPGRPEAAPFPREAGDVFLARCVAEERDSGAKIGQAWAAVKDKRVTNLARVKSAWCRFKNSYPPPAKE